MQRVRSPGLDLGPCPLRHVVGTNIDPSVTLSARLDVIALRYKCVWYAYRVGKHGAHVWARAAVAADPRRGQSILLKAIRGALAAFQIRQVSLQ